MIWRRPSMLILAGAQALVLLLASLWLVGRGADQGPGLHADSVLFVPAASRCAEGRCGEFAVYLRLFLARDPPRWTLDLHGQVYPRILGWVAGSPDYSELIRATRWVTVWVAWCVWMACWVRSEGATALRVGALPLALAVALVALSHAGRPEQLVPAVCALAWMLRRSADLRHSATGFGAEVGVVALVSPAPAIILAALYLWLILATSSGRALAARLPRFALAAFLAWFVLTLLVAPHRPWTVLAQTATAYLGARSAAPTGVWVGLQMLLAHPDVPFVGVGWLGFAWIAGAASGRRRVDGPRQVVAAFFALGLLGVLIGLLGIRTYTAQYTFVSVQLALLTVLGALHRSSSVPSARLRYVGVAALSLPVFALVTAPLSERIAFGSDVRRDIVADLPAMLAPADGYVLTLESDPMLWLVESRPAQILVGQGAGAAERARIAHAAGMRVCWVLSLHEGQHDSPELQPMGRWVGPGGREVRLSAVSGCDVDTPKDSPVHATAESHSAAGTTGG